MPKLPSAVLQTRDRYLAKFPLWVMPEGSAAELNARSWTIGLAKQIAYEHGTTYGCKRADASRPISKDAIAQVSGAQLLSWDMLSGAGTGAPTSNQNPDSADITGQLFEHVDPVDMITVGPGQPEPTPPGPAIVPPYDESYSIQFGQGCNDVYNQLPGQAIDPGMISVHSSRAAWDYYSGQMDWPASYKKHINEFRQVYGLPPV